MVGTHDEESEPLLFDLQKNEANTKRSHRLSACLVTSLLIFSIAVFFSLWYIDPFEQSHFVEEQSWAQYSPYYAAGRYRPPPLGCRVTQAHILQRHGSRYPTSRPGLLMRATLEKIKAVEHYEDPRFDYFSTLNYDLGEDDLLASGASESFDSGVLQFQRYGTIVSASNPPFVRASGSERVIHSALNWTKGFAESSAGERVVVPELSVIISEENDTLNNTLHNYACPKPPSPKSQLDEWVHSFGPPIAARFNEAAPGANLDEDDVVNLLELCAFLTAASEEETGVKGRRSKVCDIFEQDDFRDFEYWGDLEKYFGRGYGARFGKVQGAGYVNELVSRLTHTPPPPGTIPDSLPQITDDPTSFPLNRTLYADFSHDNMMVSIFSALGLFRGDDILSTRTIAGPHGARTWVVSKMVPFAGRMVLERLECVTPRIRPFGSWFSPQMGSRRMYVRIGSWFSPQMGSRRMYVRISVNDALQALEFCGAGDGMCSLDAFVESQVYARRDWLGDYENCTVGYAGDRRW